MKENQWIVSIIDIERDIENIYTVPENIVEEVVEHVSQTRPDCIIAHAPLDVLEECDSIEAFKTSFSTVFEI